MFTMLLPIIYISFISLGLPDPLLGAGWPTMMQQLSVPESYAGIISMITALGTVISSLNSDRLTYRFGTGRVTAFSVLLTAVGLFLFSISNAFWLLCLAAIPCGLGAGSVDASLNNYVALHYSSKHMSWLHCMWGVGTAIGPFILEFALTRQMGWQMGYRIISMLQLVLTAVLFLSLPSWKKRPAVAAADGKMADVKPLPLLQIIRIPGAREVMLAFFCYCALESTTGLWASSYMFLHLGVAPEVAAGYASLFFMGITLGRGLNGFLTARFSDIRLNRAGFITCGMGIVVLMLAKGEFLALAGLFLIGLGCAPVYPGLIHSTPAHFGADKSQAIIGVQMASAYVGTFLMPPFFGLIGQHIAMWLLPFFLMIMLLLMVWNHENLIRKTKGFVRQHAGA